MQISKPTDCWSVYLHIFPNGKRYVGITSKDPVKRWGRSGSGYRGQSLMYSAIKKYGWDNIQHIVLCSGLSKESAYKHELELISQYQTTDLQHGYNLSIGGYGGYGVKRSEETRKKIRDNHADTSGENCYWFGKKLSQSHRDKISANHADFTEGKHPRAKPVYCVELDRRFDCTRQAERILGIRHVANCCRGTRKTAGGYHWVYANENGGETNEQNCES